MVSSGLLNLLLQFGMGLALLAGMLLARAKNYRAHGICQSVVVVLNLGAIALFMSPMFRKGALSELPRGLGDPYYAVATAHAALGTIAEIFALYILLNAGTHLLPRALRFENYKPFMRTALGLWWAVILFGVGTYWYWNVNEGATAAPTTPRQTTPPASEGAAPSGPKTIAIGVRNFEFDAKEVTIEAGDTVTWTIEGGRHTVTADNNSFDTPILNPSGEFSFTFDQVGTIQYYCAIHGGPDGQDMSGKIIVTPRAP
jgi:plastocyanin/uncharacterized membrane protein YozB (DUF420 family)